MNVYLLNINSLLEEDIELVKSRLPNRYNDSNKFSYEKGRLTSLASAYLLLQVFKDVKEEDIYFNEYGKPYLKGNLFFNISHDEDLTAIATNEEEIGLDIECSINEHVTLVNKCFPKEIEFINKDNKINFYIVWTLKEAVIKALGLGLKLDPFSFDVSPLIKGKSIIVNGVKLYSKTTIYDNYVISLVSPKKIKDINIIRIK